jgi:hypothetical protein
MKRTRTETQRTAGQKSEKIENRIAKVLKAPNILHQHRIIHTSGGSSGPTGSSPLIIENSFHCAADSNWWIPYLQRVELW